MLWSALPVRAGAIKFVVRQGEKRSVPNQLLKQAVDVVDDVASCQIPGHPIEAEFPEVSEGKDCRKTAYKVVLKDGASSVDQSAGCMPNTCSKNL